MISNTLSNLVDFFSPNLTKLIRACFHIVFPKMMNNVLPFEQTQKQIIQSPES